ncbi:hypothetical protein BKA62DRAFT_810911 [Auriculariales sp. MPI-PUGE-AT-0066]|nr:hypothetical protein BKA62DRAFT_810911 [Auriculariales sp. MPI-PUGE-AT-0066]
MSRSTDGNALHSDFNAFLGIARPALKAIPAIGNIVEGTVEALLAISKQAETASKNKDDWAALYNHACSVTYILLEAIRDRPEGQLAALVYRIDLFNSVLFEAVAVTQRKASWVVRFFRAASDAELIAEMRRRISDAAIQFLISAQTRIEAGIAEVHRQVKDVASKLDSVAVEQQRQSQRQESREEREREQEESRDRERKRAETSRQRVLLEQALKPAHSAAHYAATSARPCADGTRVELLTTILEWASATFGPRIYWLAGLAGTGKTTIAQSMCKQSEQAGANVLSFFISRGDGARNRAGQIVTTLSYQLARCDDGAAELITTASQELRSPTDYPVAIQTERLLVGPLKAYSANSTKSLIIVIDALDEGTDMNEFSEFVDGGGYDMFAALIPVLCQIRCCVKLLVTSRPDPNIHIMLNNIFEAVGCDQRTIFKLHDVDEATVSADIRTFCTQSFAEIHRLVTLSGKLFVYAATVVRYVGRARGSAVDLLEDVLRAAEESLPTRAHTVSLYATLDALYLDVLRRATYEDAIDPAAEINITIRMLLIMIISDKPFLTRASFPLFFKPREILWISYFSLSDRSFADFIEDSRRCTDSRFCTADHAARTRLCLLYLKQMTENNFSNLEEVPKSVRMAMYSASTQWFVEFSRGSWTDTVNQSAILELFNPKLFSIHWVGHCDYLHMMSFCHLFDLVSQRRPAILREFRDCLDKLTVVTLGISNDWYKHTLMMHVAMACALLTVANMPDGDSRGQKVTNFSSAFSECVLTWQAYLPQRIPEEDNYSEDEYIEDDYIEQSMEEAISNMRNKCLDLTGIEIGTSQVVDEWTLLRCCVELKVKYANDAQWTYNPEI